MTQHRYQEFTVGSPSIYRLTVFGKVGADWREELGGMQITQVRADDDSERTVLVGRLADQAALIGILNALYSMGLPVLSVECLEVEKR